MEVVRQACYDGNIKVILRFIQFGKYQNLLIDSIKLYVNLCSNNTTEENVSNNTTENASSNKLDFEQFLDLVKQKDPSFDYDDYIQCVQDLGWTSDDEVEDDDVDDYTLLTAIANDQRIKLPYQEAIKEIAILAYSLGRDEIVDLLFQQ